MEKFELPPEIKYGIMTTKEEVDGSEIYVQWTALGTENYADNDWKGKIVGKGSDGSKWEGEGEIQRIQVEGKTVALNADSVLNKKLIN